jgi:hypothetical protein
MSGFSRNLAALLLTGLVCVFLPSSAAAQKGGVHKPVKKKQNKPDPAAPVLPAYTPAPLQPVPLDQVPAVAPRVQYSNGELTIVAHNSTLSDVLKAVKQQTGADLEIPPNATERVVADVGPGPARNVLAELLNGTHFNYVMVGSATDPTAVQSIVLTAKSGAPDTATAAANRPTQQRGFPGASAVQGTPAEATPAMDNDADDAENNEEPADQGDQQNQQNAAQPNSNPQTPKTPEELLQELQRQQQQQQQQKPPAGQPQGILPNQPPTAAPANPNRPD